MEFTSDVHPPEVSLIKLAYMVSEKLLLEYAIPYWCNFYPSISTHLLRPSSCSKFDENRTTIAAYMKTVFPKVKIILLNDAKLYDEIIEKQVFDQDCVKFIGLDCEWEPSTKSGVSLIQISFGSICLLYRLNKAHGVVPDKLKDILGDRHILKFGVAIQEDVKRLLSHGVHVSGFVDLRNLARRCLPHVEDDVTPAHARNTAMASNNEQVGRWTSLRLLAQNLLDMTLNKSYHERCSDWEATVLSNAQILYAAKDAIASLEIFYALVLLRKLSRQSMSVLSDAFEKGIVECGKGKVDLTPTEEVYKCFNYSRYEDHLSDFDLLELSSDVFLPAEWLIKHAHSLCQGIVDTKHKNKPTPGDKNRKNHHPSSPPKPPSSKSKIIAERNNEVRSRPYRNCLLLGPNDQVLATINPAKVRWYIRNKLGAITCEDPLTVKIFFEPSGKPPVELDTTNIGESVCIACEKKDNLLRKSIVPNEYRKHFPTDMNQINSLLLCLDCHRTSRHWDEKLRLKLAEEYDAPILTKEQRSYLDNSQLARVKSAAKALCCKGRAKIPEARQKELLAVVGAYVGPDEEVNDELLTSLSKMAVNKEKESNASSHGQIVVEALVKEGKVDEFIQMWREHFLAKMQPKHYPFTWQNRYFSNRVQSG